MKTSGLLLVVGIMFIVAGCGESSALDASAERFFAHGREQSDGSGPVGVVHSGVGGAIDAVFYAITLGYDESKDTGRYGHEGRGYVESGSSGPNWGSMSSGLGSFDLGNINIGCPTGMDFGSCGGAMAGCVCP